MRYMADGLTRAGYQTLAPTLPTTLGSLESCTRKLENFLQGRLMGYDKVHFVGHSMGGLVVRCFLSRNRIPSPGRCVLCGVPNRGVFLARPFARYPLFRRTVRILPALTPPGIPIGPPLNRPSPDIGLVGGTYNRGLAFGFLFGARSDGRVPVDSLSMEGSKDTAWLPMNHHKIHRSPEGLSLVLRFLETGHF